MGVVSFGGTILMKCHRRVQSKDSVPSHPAEPAVWYKFLFPKHRFDVRPLSIDVNEMEGTWLIDDVSILELSL